MAPIMSRQKTMPWFVRGDLDGFFGLGLDNLVQLLVINTLCTYVLGFDAPLLYGRVLPAIAVSLIIGNLFYAWQARKLAEQTGRTDVCALPYGINTPAVFAFILLVMLPAKLIALANGATDAEAARAAWHAGIVACFGSGLIELGGAFVAERIRKITPRAALLSTLAGIALTFISITFLFRTFERPIVGLTTLAIILLAYFGHVKFKGGLPAGLVAVAVGTALAWATGIGGQGDLPDVSLHLPVPVIGDLIEAFGSGYGLTAIAVIIPMGVFNVIGSMQNIESAEAEGDLYPTAPSLAANGIGTLVAATFGSCFPTTIYIGHPGWKRMGARAGYSILNAIFITFICLTGTIAHVQWLVPLDAAMAIVLWIGIVIAAQAYTATPKHHAPAVVIGFLPAIAAWGALMIKHGLAIGSTFRPADKPMVEEAVRQQFQDVDVWLGGVFALEQGFIFTAMILSAATVMVIERRFYAAACWCLIAAALSATGLIHGYRWESGNTVLALGWPGDIGTWPWVIGYSLMALLFALAPWITKPDDSGIGDRGSGH
jgi:AGZA family xanthine/uracil permease-like MFS transporter